MFEVSERAHAGLQLMAALAAHPDERLRLQSLAPDIGISPAYLEEIAAALRKANLIEGRQGPGGGYRLTRAPQEITLEHIATALEGKVTLVECQSATSHCPHERTCRTKSVWQRLQQSIYHHLRSMTLQDVL
jgi:Rrf2 family protein